MRSADGSGGEWRRGWTLLLASASAVGASTIHIYALGALFVPIEQSLGWSRTMVSSGMMIVAVPTTLAVPFIGQAVDRFGPRRIGIPGLVFYFLGVAGLSLTTSEPWIWWGLWALVAAGYLCIGPTIWTAGVASRFDANRGAALACTLCSTGITASLLPLLARYLSQALDWRTALVAIAAGGAALTLPLVLLFFYGAQDGRRAAPDGMPARAALSGVAMRQALTSWPFVQLAFAALAFTISIVGTIVHFIPILDANRLAPGLIAIAGALLGLSMIAGRLATGFLIDRVSAKLVGAVIFMLPVLAWLGLLYGGTSTILVCVVACLTGFANGAEVDIVVYLTSRLFGMRHFGGIFGTIAGLLALATGLGPLLAAMVFDHFQSYHPVGWLFILLFVFGSVSLTTLRMKRPD
jgi:predicted MFS family arabinose efflux permease